MQVYTMSFRQLAATYWGIRNNLSRLQQVKYALDAVEMNQPRSNCSICYPNQRNTHFFDNLESGGANWYDCCLAGV